MLYKAERLKIGFRLNLLVEEKVIVEIKSIDGLPETVGPQAKPADKFQVSHVKGGNCA